MHSVYVVLTVKHLLIERAEFNEVRRRFYQASSLENLFRTVKADVILDFLNAAVLLAFTLLMRISL